jgi:hypothetical protein
MHWPKICQSIALTSASNIFSFKLSLLSALVLIPLLLKPLLDCDTNEGDYMDAPKGSYEVVYEDLVLSVGF